MTELEQRRGPGRPPLNRDMPVEMAATNPDEDVLKIRREKRRPFSSLSQKLAWEPREGYHRHWFNDAAGRIQQALEAGYEHVKDRDGKKATRIVGKDEGGNSLHAFLMEIPEEWYKEDMAREQALIADREEAIKHGMQRAPDGSVGPSVENGYVAKNLGGIRIGDKPR